MLNLKQSIYANWHVIISASSQAHISIGIIQFVEQTANQYAPDGIANEQMSELNIGVYITAYIRETNNACQTQFTAS